MYQLIAQFTLRVSQLEYLSLCFLLSITNTYRITLHELCKERNMQQAELAKLVGVRRETIGNLENGRYNPSLKLAMDIAKVFDTTVEDIFTFEEDGE